MASAYSRAKKAGEDAANDYRAAMSAGRVKSSKSPVVKTKRAPKARSAKRK